MALENASYSKHLQCVVVTPERAVLDETVDFVSIPMYDGELGVLPGRLPLIGRLGTGELRYLVLGKHHHFFVDGGFVQVKDDVVTILTSRAIKAEEIKPQEARQLLAAKSVAGSDEVLDGALKSQERARQMLRVAAKADSAR